MFAAENKQMMQMAREKKNKTTYKFYCVLQSDEANKKWDLLTEQQKNAMNVIAGKMSFTGRVNLAGKNRDEMMHRLKIKIGRFYQLIRQLRGEDLIRKERGGDFLVNPAFYFKGNPADLEDKMKSYYYNINE